jgi:transcription initiation factor IIE alpha subunit
MKQEITINTKELNRCCIARVTQHTRDNTGRLEADDAFTCPDCQQHLVLADEGRWLSWELGE